MILRTAEAEAATPDRKLRLGPTTVTGIGLQEILECCPDIG